MIPAQALQDYILTIPEVATKVGTNVYFGDVPSDATIPWIIVEPDGPGRGKRITPNREETISQFTLRYATTNAIEGMFFMDIVRSKLRRFRGDMPPADDVFIECGLPYPTPGWGNAVNIMVHLTMRCLETVDR